MSNTLLARPHEGAATLSPTTAWRVEIFRHPDRIDPEGEHVSHAMAELGLPTPTGVRVGRGYLLSPNYSEAAVHEIGEALLADPVLDVIRWVAPGQLPAAPPAGTHRILVMSRPGVMNPVARTVEDLLVRTGRMPTDGGPGIQTFRAFEIQGTLTPDQLEQTAGRILANDTIELVRIDREELAYDAAFPASLRGRILCELLEAGNEELLELSRAGQLSLTLVEMHAVQAHFRKLEREPSTCELETIAQTWSEHCKHKTLTGIVDYEGPDGEHETIDNLLKTTIARATHELDRDWCVSVFEDNAGIVAFDKGFDLAIKVETHNHPSALDPYGGAGTGIGGVIRDLLGAGLGSRPIANTDAFFVGPADLAADEVPRGTMHPRRILRGVVAGVRDYGNRMGIPTVNGGVWYDPGYTANPLVYAGTVGLIPHGMAFKQVKPGDAIVTVGGRTGRDGIHGATFSSIELTEDSETVSSAAVQIGDPITEKRVLDALLQARDLGLYRGITDCGAGGFSSAVGEMGEHCGADVELASVPLKYPGLSSHEIWISEAQERMVLSVPPEHVEACLAVFAAEDVEACVIGKFTATGRLVVRDAGEVVCDLGMKFLHRGTPRPYRVARYKRPLAPDPGCPACEDANAALLTLLATPTLASKEWIIRQYDHEVQGTSVVKPLVGTHSDGPSDGAVLKPLADSSAGCVIGCGALPALGKLDPRAMAEATIDEAIRNAVAVGADPSRIAILDNFSWGNCDRPEQLGSLVEACKGCYDAAVAYGTPFVSGKDSLNNEYRVKGETLSIPPTLLITALGVIPDVAQATTMDAKEAGNVVYLVGSTRPELAGSYYLSEIHGVDGVGGAVPRPDLKRAPRVLAALHSAIRSGLCRSVHDLSEGGLALAAAEMAFAGSLGMRLDLTRVPFENHDGRELVNYDDDAMRLFAESCTRFLVEVEPDRCRAFEQCLAELPHERIGEITAEPRLCILGKDSHTRIDLPIEELRQAYGSEARL